MKNKLAIVDIDGVLSSIDYALQKAFIDLGYPNTEIVHSWDSEANSPFVNAMMKTIKRREGFWSSIPRIDSGFIIVDILRECGYTIHLATGLPTVGGRALGEKAEWRDRFMPGTPLHITEDKTVITGDILVDDGPDFARPWLKRNPNGKIIMPQYDYNRDFLTEESLNLNVFSYSPECLESSDVEWLAAFLR